MLKLGRQFKDIIYNPNVQNDHSFNGDKWLGTAGETLTFGDVCYRKDDGKFWKADATAESTSLGFLVITLYSLSANDLAYFGRRGFIRDDSWGYTVGNNVHVRVGGGTPTQLVSSTAGQIKRIIGYANSSSILWFDPDNTYVGI